MLQPEDVQERVRELAELGRKAAEAERQRREEESQSALLQLPVSTGGVIADVLLEGAALVNGIFWAAPGSVKGTNPALKKPSNIPEIYAKMFGRFH